MLNKAIRCSEEPASRSRNTASEAKRLHVKVPFCVFVNATRRGGSKHWELTISGAAKNMNSG